VQSEPTSLTCQERGSLSSDQHGLLVPGRGSPPSGLGTLNRQQEVKTLPCESWTSTPEMSQEGSDGDREGTKAFGKQDY
jgi:hypothetical protein